MTSWRNEFFNKKNKGLGLNLWESILREGDMIDDEEECCDDIDEALDIGHDAREDDDGLDDKGPMHDLDDLEEDVDLPPWMDDDEDDEDDDDEDFSNKKTKRIKKGNESVTNNSYKSGEGKNGTYRKKGTKGGIRKDPPKPTK